MVDEQSKKLRILIVDNHAEVLKQIATRLSYEEDFEVCMVAPLAKLTESVIACKPDVLLIDPYVDSDYKFDHLKLATQLRPSMTIVVLTAVVDTAAQIRMKQVGVSCILEKGVSSGELVGALRGVLVEHCKGTEVPETKN